MRPKWRHVCPKAVYLVIDKFLYVTSDISPLCQILKQSDNYSSLNVALQWCSAMVLCHGALPWCSAMVLCHGALPWCSATVLCSGALPRCSALPWCSAIVLCHGALHGTLPRCSAMVHIQMHRKSVVFETVAKYISGGTRTHNLRIRSPTRYPLRHGDIWDLLFADNFSKCATYVHMNDEILLTFKGTIEILHICSCYTNTNHSHFVWLMEWLISLNKYWNSIYDT